MNEDRDTDEGRSYYWIGSMFLCVSWAVGVFITLKYRSCGLQTLECILGTWFSYVFTLQLSGANNRSPTQHMTVRTIFYLGLCMNMFQKPMESCRMGL